MLSVRNGSGGLDVPDPTTTRAPGPLWNGRFGSMFVAVGPGSPPQLQDPTNFRELKVLWDVETPLSNSGIEPAGHVAGEHVWLDPTWLREQGRDYGREWEESFIAMVDYARENGWTDAEGLLRAHVQRGPSEPQA